MTGAFIVSRLLFLHARDVLVLPLQQQILKTTFAGWLQDQALGKQRQPSLPSLSVLPAQAFRKG